MSTTSNYFDDKPAFLEPQVHQYARNMVMTGVMKSPKIKYINVDTRFANDYDTKNGEYMVTLPERLNEVKSVRVRQVEIPMTFYNVSAALANNMFQIVNASGTVLHTCVVPDGNYTVATLTTAVASLFSGVGLTYTTSSAGKSSISGGNGTTSVLFWSAAFSGSFKMQLGWLLGFRKAQYALAGGGATTGSEAVVNPAPIRYLYLVMDEFNAASENSFVSPMGMSLMAPKMLCRIKVDPVVYPYGTLLTGGESTGILWSGKRTYNGGVNLQKLAFKLVNEWGLEVALNGLDFSCLLEVECL